MKNLIGTLCALLMITLLLTACRDDDDSNQSNAPTPEEFQSLRQTALDNITQNYQIDLQNGWATFTSNQGVELTLGGCVELSGEETTGVVDLEYAEIFDRGGMLVTNKPTMGILPSGEEGVLVSGGEFYFNVMENGTQLDYCYINATVPTNLTGGTNYNMTDWRGEIDTDGNITWTPFNNDFGADSLNYSLYVNQFGWINCDVFWDDPRPRTSATIEVPQNYDNQNSAVYFMIVGEPTALGTLGGNFPIGLESHFVFVTSEGDDWRYDVKSVTISEDEVVTFELDDTVVVTESELIDVINALP